MREFIGERWPRLQPFYLTGRNKRFFPNRSILSFGPQTPLVPIPPPSVFRFTFCSVSGGCTSLRRIHKIQLCPKVLVSPAHASFSWKHSKDFGHNTHLIPPQQRVPVFSCFRTPLSLFPPLRNLPPLTLRNCKALNGVLFST